MNCFKLFLFIPLILGSCSQTFNVTTDSMSNTFNAGEVIKLKNKASTDRGDAVFFSRDRSSGKGKETWLFRVVAFSGDTVQIKDGNIIVNNNSIELPVKARLLYSVTTSMPLDEKSFRENTVRRVDDNRYVVHFTMDEYAKVSGSPGVTGINRIIRSPGDHAEGIVRNSYTDNWNEDQFGPLYIPTVGEKIKISQTNRGLYADILADMQPDSTITIKEKLYFLMGDNRGNAFDSRFIGFVAASRIIGYADEKP